MICNLLDGVLHPRHGLFRPSHLQYEILTNKIRYFRIQRLIAFVVLTSQPSLFVQ